MTDDTHLDGNVAAGPLRVFFAIYLTHARGQCDACGVIGPLAETTVYVEAPGVVVRCRVCQGVLVRVVEAPDRAWLDLRGLRHLEVAL